MARKKQEIIETPKMTEAQYWELRCTQEELKFSKLNEKKVHLEREIMNKEIENRKLRLALFKETLKSSRAFVEQCEKEHENTLERLSKDIGVDLKNCSIDPYTFEVKSLELIEEN